MVTRWTIYDPTNATTTAFEVNPSEGGTPARKKTITYQNTSAPNGKVIVFEGRDEPQAIKFSGTILYESQYTQFLNWFNTRHQVLLTDDLNRQYWIYITSFDATRQRAVQHPWKHSYNIEATIVDWP
jgi:hypothetical protein